MHRRTARRRSTRPAVALLPLALVAAVAGPALVTTAQLVSPAAASAAAPTAGDVMVYRVGDGSAALSSAATAVFLDEYTPAGTLVQSIALPTASAGAQHRLTASGSATSEGLISDSADGRYLLATGYDASAGTASVAGTPSATTPRTVARLDGSGALDTSTALTDFSTGNNPRAVASADGANLFVAGGAGGIRYATLGSSTSTQLSTTLTNLRGVGVAGGQLYTSTQSGSAIRLGTVGTGLPTTAGQMITNLPGYPVNGSPNAFLFADLSPSVTGVDTVYVADSTAGVQKYTLSGGAWSLTGTFGTAGDAYTGVTGTVAGTTATLFASGPGKIVKLVDSTGYNAAPTGSPTLVGTAATNTAFRGIAMAPVAPPAAADLRIAASGPGTATTGTAYSYTLTPSNAGGSSAAGVSVSFTLPTGVSYTSSSVGSGGFGTGTVSNGVLSFTGGTLAAGASGSITVTVTPTAAGTVTVPAGAVTTATTSTESSTANNANTTAITTTVSDPVVAPNLTVTATGPSTATSGTPYSYTVTPSNGGGSYTANTVVSVKVPGALTAVSGSGPGGWAVTQTVSAATSGVPAATTLTFTGPPLANGASATLTATGQPTAAGTVTLPATAVVVDPANAVSESNETDNSPAAAVATTVSDDTTKLTTAADSYRVGQGTTGYTTAAVGAPTVLANDTNATTPVVTTQPAHGTVQVAGDGSFGYVPAAGFTGTDSFSYTATNAVHDYKTNLPTLGTFNGLSVTGGGYGSALYQVPGSTTGEVYGVTDRGPNVDGPNGTKVEPIPSFQPAIGKFALVNGTAVLEKRIGLFAADGTTPYSGRVNSDNNTNETITDLNGTVLPADKNGYDPEGLVALPDGTFWVSDEYGPFITHFDANGRQIGRLSPFDNTLPNELQNRLANRGLEGLTVTPDGTMLVAAMQSALMAPDNGTTDPKKIAVLRVTTITLSSGALHEYLYALDNPGTTKTAVSEITAVSGTQFLMDERDGNFGPGSYKRLYTIDISGATDIGPASPLIGTGAITYDASSSHLGLLVNGKSIEATIGTTATAAATTTLANAGITPVTKALKLDVGNLLDRLDPTGAFFSHDKIEGISTTDGGKTLTIANDSDFGIVSATANSSGPDTLVAKTSPATGAQDDGEFIVVDTTKVPALTSTATVTITVVPVPGAPTGVSAQAGDQRAVVSFTPPAARPDAPVSGYVVTATPVGGGATVTLTITDPGATSGNVTGLTDGVAYTFTVLAQTTANGGGNTDSGSPSVAGGPVTPRVVDGEYVPLAPTRLLDTRLPGDLTGGRPVGPGLANQLTVPALGRAGLPAAGVTAVVLNLTAVDASSYTFVSALTDPATETPSTSNLNLGGVKAVEVTVPVSADGSITLYNDQGTVDLIADVEGYYSDDTGLLAGRVHAEPAVRFFDTRDGSGVPEAPVGPGGTLDVAVTGGSSGVPAGATAAIVNLTAADASTDTYVTAYAADGVQPGTSTLNLGRGDVVSNLVTVPLSADGRLRLYNDQGTVDLLGDVVGWVTPPADPSGSRYLAATPQRYLDTRTGLGGAPLGEGGTDDVAVGAPAGATAVLTGVTLVNPSTATYLTLNPAGSTSQDSSTVTTFGGGGIASNAALTALGDDAAVSDGISVTNNSGTADALVDVEGYLVP